MSGVARGTLFLFARQVRFFERHSPQNQTPRAGGWVKTNYGGVKRQAQWGKEKTVRLSAPLDLGSAASSESWKDSHFWFEETHSQTSCLRGRDDAGGKKGKFPHKRNGGIVGGGASTWKILLRVPSNQFQFDSQNGGMKYHSSFHLGLGSLRETRVDRYPSHPSKWSLW